MKENFNQLLKSITNQELPYGKVCVVREAVNKIGEYGNLIFNVEPIDAPNFELVPSYFDDVKKQIKPNIVTGSIEDIDLNRSKRNWIYNARLTADPTLQYSPESKDAIPNAAQGVFNIPEIGSYVIVEFLNNTDAYITATSKISAIQMAGAGGGLISSLDEKIEVDNKLMKFVNSDIFQVLTNSNTNFTISNFLNLQRDQNFIRVQQNGIKINASNVDDSLDELAKGVTVSGHAFYCTVDRFNIESTIIELNSPSSIFIDGEKIILNSSAIETSLGDLVNTLTVSLQTIGLIVQSLNLNTAPIDVGVQSSITTKLANIQTILKKAETQVKNGFTNQ